MTALADDLVREFRAELEEIASDPLLDAEDRVRRLCELRSELDRARGVLATYLQEAELERGPRIGDDVRVARANADMRDELIRRGLLEARDLDEVGYVSHEALDIAAEQGRLEEFASAAVGHAFGLGLLHGETFNKRVVRGRGGKFEGHGR